jgi:hypothetical protein
MSFLLAAATSTNSHTFISFLAFASPLIADVYYTIRINPKFEQILINQSYPANKGEHMSFLTLLAVLMLDE